MIARTAFPPNPRAAATVTGIPRRERDESPAFVPPGPVASATSIHHHEDEDSTKRRKHEEDDPCPQVIHEILHSTVMLNTTSGGVTIWRVSTARSD